jgi:hypothetical protein
MEILAITVCSGKNVIYLTLRSAVDVRYLTLMGIFAGRGCDISLERDITRIICDIRQYEHM